jgi:hypothetical protein
MMIEMLTLRLKKKTGTIGGFDIFETNGSAPTDLMPQEVPVIDRHEFLTIALVLCNTQKFKGYFSQTHIVQDLQWSQELIENSC